MKIPKQNYAFIDGQNLNLAIRDLGWRLDLKKFRVYLKDLEAKLGYIKKKRTP